MVRGIPAAVTNNGLADAPRRTPSVRRRLERRLGHAYDGNAELGVHVSTKTGSAIWVQVNVAVDDNQAASFSVAKHTEYRPDGRQFTQIELARPVARNPRDDQRALLQYGGESGVCRGYDGGPGTGTDVVDVHSADVLPVASGDLHRSTMDHRPGRRFSGRALPGRMVG